MSAGDTAPGTRLQPSRVDEDGNEWFAPESGSYWFERKTGHWAAVTPNGLHGNLSNHDVVEHEDGTITVSPSILVEQGSVGSWHGYLERGIWREV